MTKLIIEAVWDSIDGIMIVIVNNRPIGTIDSFDEKETVDYVRENYSAIMAKMEKDWTAHIDMSL